MNKWLSLSLFLFGAGCAYACSRPSAIDEGPGGSGGQLGGQGGDSSSVGGARSGGLSGGGGSSLPQPQGGQSQAGQGGTNSAGAGGAMATTAKKNWVFVGGYGTTIETFSMNNETGTLTSVGVMDGVAEAPTFLALDEKRKQLFAISEKGGPDAPVAGKATSFHIDPATGNLSKINEVAAGGDNTVFVVQSRSEKHLLTASSSTAQGKVGVIPLSADGTLAAPSDSVVAGKNAHGLVQSPNGEFVWVVCRGDDLVAQYRLNESTGKLSPLAIPTVAISEKPAGPRHITVHPTLNFVYVLLDWGGKIVTYRYGADGALSNPKVVSIFPLGKQPTAVTGTQTAAELAISADGKHLYATTRAAAFQSIAVMDVGNDGQPTLIANEEGGGLIKGPRHFALTTDGRLLVLSNQDNNTLLVFEVDATSGRLKRLGGAVASKVKMPNAIALGSF